MHTTENKTSNTINASNKNASGNTPFFQAKLAINEPGDVYEQEADAMADKVMRMPMNDQPFFSPKPLGISHVQRKCAHCEEEEKLQMKAESGGSARMTAPPIVHDVINSDGQPLDVETKGFMESRFGYDFSDVQIHNDSLAHQSAADINAFAYTHNNHVVFGAGQYEPNTNSGKQLLAHELTHVIQQNHSSSLISRRKKEENEQLDYDEGFLLCLALCYLGIPTPIWKEIAAAVASFFKEYAIRAKKSEEARKEYEEIVASIKAYQALNILKFILSLLVNEKSIKIPLTQKKLFIKTLSKILSRAGITDLRLGVAFEILSGVATVIEVTILGLCGGMCYSEAYAKAIILGLETVFSSLAEIVSIIGGVGQAFTRDVIFRPIFIARAKMNPENWDLSLVPSNQRSDFVALGLYLWHITEPENLDNFITKINRPFDYYPIPFEIIQSVSKTATLMISKKRNLDIVIDPSELMKSSPLSFIEFMAVEGIIKFKVDPEEIADKELMIP